MRKKRIVPLVKISGDSSIYFDFEKGVPYIQHFKGPYTEAAGNSYSSGLAYLLSYALLGGAALAGAVLDHFFKFPILISIIIALILGYVLVKIFLRIFLTNSLGEREYRAITKKEVSKAISNSGSFWIIWIAEIVIILGILLVTVIFLSEGELSGKSVIMFGVSSFAAVGLHDAVHPKKALKARRILKKQMKEGKFDD